MRTKLAIAGFVAALIVLLVGLFYERPTLTMTAEDGNDYLSEAAASSGETSRPGTPASDTRAMVAEPLHEGIRTAERLLAEARTHGGSPNITPDLDPSTEFTKANARYLQEVVAPRLSECWGDVQGDGEIEFRHVLYIDGSGLARVPSPEDQIEPPVSIVDSSLPPEEDAKALNCMLQAVAGTEYEYVPMHADDDSGKVALYQTWPSPERERRLAREEADGP